MLYNGQITEFKLLINDYNGYNKYIETSINREKVKLFTKKTAIEILEKKILAIITYAKDEVKDWYQLNIKNLQQELIKIREIQTKSQFPISEALENACKSISQDDQSYNFSSQFFTARKSSKKNVLSDKSNLTRQRVEIQNEMNSVKEKYGKLNQVTQYLATTIKSAVVTIFENTSSKLKEINEEMMNQPGNFSSEDFMFINEINDYQNKYDSIIEIIDTNNIEKNKSLDLITAQIAEYNKTLNEDEENLVKEYKPINNDEEEFIKDCLKLNSSFGHI